MSVMNAGRKSKALVRPLRAGNSRAGERPGRTRAGEPGAAASRPEKRNLPGVSGPARADKAVPGRRRVTGDSPARPPLWAVPDAPRPASAGPADRDPGVAGMIPLVPRPRVAPDKLIPAPPGGPREGPGSGQPGRGQDYAAGRTRAPQGPQALRPRPGQPGPWRGPASSPARVIRPASAPARGSAGRGRRSRLTRRGRRVLWAAAVLLLVAVLTPLLLALASGAQASSHGLPPSAVRSGMRQVVVKPGQSLWSVAQNAEPDADPRVVIQQIMEFNAMGSQVVVPGQSLWVPRA